MSTCPTCGQYVHEQGGATPVRATYAACSNCDAVECSTAEPCCVNCSESAGLNHVGDTHPATMIGRK